MPNPALSRRAAAAVQPPADLPWRDRFRLDAAIERLEPDATFDDLPAWARTLILRGEETLAES